MFEFASSSQFLIAGRGMAYAVENPVECEDFGHLLGAAVLIDGTRRKIVGVERAAHAPPWRKGEGISLMTALTNPPWPY